MLSMKWTWDAMSRVVEESRARLLRELPVALRQAAGEIAVACERRPSPEALGDGIDEDTLGLFEGPSLMDEEGDWDLPPRIVLYLDNLRDEAERVESRFRDEVRITLLHELGHYLGFDESELVERELE
jgi:predicted Zn-dependent protease with MMP-like domain